MKEKDAKRLARAIVADISSRNQTKIREGIEHDDLSQRLKDVLDEGRRFYETYVHSDLRHTTDFYGDEVDTFLFINMLIGTVEKKVNHFYNPLTMTPMDRLNQEIVLAANEPERLALLTYKRAMLSRFEAILAAVEAAIIETLSYH